MKHDHGKLKKEPIFTRNFIFIAIVSLLISLGFQMLLPVLPYFSVQIGGSDAWAGLVIGIFTISAVLIRPFAGSLLDKQGRKAVFIIGLIVFLFCVVAYNWVTSILMLLAIRFVHGFGWGATSTATSTIASDIIPQSRLAEGMGYFGLTNTLAMAVAPALGLQLLKSFDFHMVFHASTALIILSVILAFSIKYYNPNQDRERRVAEEHKSALAEMLEKTAILPAVVIFFITMTYGSIVSFIALYADERKIENIGLFFSVYAIALLISRPYFGRLTDRKGPSYAILPGAGLVVLAMLFIYFAQTITAILIAGFVYGVGFGAVSPALQAMAVSKVIPTRRGAANATFFLGFDLGIGIGSIIWGAISEALSYQLIYLVAIIPAVIGTLVYIHSRERWKLITAPH